MCRGHKTRKHPVLLSSAVRQLEEVVCGPAGVHRDGGSRGSRRSESAQSRAAAYGAGTAGGTRRRLAPEIEKELDTKGYWKNLGNAMTNQNAQSENCPTVLMAAFQRPSLRKPNLWPHSFVAPDPSLLHWFSRKANN
jgi:hypothetical protein